MKIIIRTIGLCILACMLCCCKGKKANSDNPGEWSTVNSQLSYAQGFQVKSLTDGIYLIDIQESSPLQNNLFLS